MPNLVLLRHGISYTNEGRQIDVEQQNLLSRVGIQQALLNAEMFRVQHPDLHFDHAILSPYHRAVQTGLNFLSVFENKPIDLRYEDDLRERTYGFGRYIVMDALIEQFGQDVVDTWDSHLDTRPHVNGESQLDVYERVIPVYLNTVVPLLEKGDTVLIVAHFYVLKALQSYIDTGGPNAITSYHPKNCTPICYDIGI